MDLKEIGFFAGVGGFSLGAEQAGIESIMHCEIDSFKQKILKQHFPKALLWDDIETLTGQHINDFIKERNISRNQLIFTAGSPCQDISVSGKGEGITGSRSGLWTNVPRIAKEVNPAFITLENSSQLIRKGLEKVLYDLSEIGYDAEWQCLQGTDFGVQQRRERIYLIAYSTEVKLQRSRKGPIFQQSILQRESARISPEWKTRWDIPEPRNYGSTNDLPDLMDRIKAVGDAVMPRAAKYILSVLKTGYNGKQINFKSYIPRILP